MGYPPTTPTRGGSCALSSRCGGVRIGFITFDTNVVMSGRFSNHCHQVLRVKRTYRSCPCRRDAASWCPFQRGNGAPTFNRLGMGVGKGGGGGGVGGRGFPPPPPLFGANLIHFLYKVLGWRSVQKEPFKKITFKATPPPPLEKVLPTPLLGLALHVTTLRN